jgi:hypothetical protein
VQRTIPIDGLMNPSRMRTRITLCLSLFLTAIGCVQTVSSEGLRRTADEGMAETVNSWWYIGSDDAPIDPGRDVDYTHYDYSYSEACE